MKHPDLDTLPPGVTSLVLHLLACPSCRDRMVREARLLRVKGRIRQDLQSSDYRAIGAGGEAVVRRFPDPEREERCDLLAELLALAPEERLDKVREDTRFHSYRLAEDLIGHVFEPPPGESGSALARLVLEILAELEGSGSMIRQELEALAHTALGESLRREREDERAEEELTCAANGLSGGIEVDPETRAVFCQSLAALRRDQGRFYESVALFSYAAELWRDAGAGNDEAEAWLQVGDIARVEALDPERALAAFDSAAAIPGISAHLAFCALSGTVHTLLQLEQLDEARELLKHGRKRLRFRRGTHEALELLALEGRLELGCGRLSLARECLIEAFRGLVRGQASFAALQAGVDLARLLIKDPNGRRPLSQLLFELEDLARDEKLPNPVRTAVKSCLTTAPSPGRLTALADHLERARLRPHLKFTLEEPDDRRQRIH